MTTFANGTPWAVPDFGVAHSSVHVTGLTGLRFRISLYVQIDHGFANDLDLLLVAPDLKSNLLFFSDYGGTISNRIVYVSDWGSVPTSRDYVTPLNGYIYPTDFYDVETPSNWPGLFANVKTIQHPQPNGSLKVNFSTAFGGVNPNGVWTLWARDDRVGEAGQITYFELDIKPVATPRDFNRDQRGDLLWRHSGGQVGVWNANGSGGFNPMNADSRSNDWTLLGAADIDGDGMADILWRHNSGALSLWPSTGAGFQLTDYGSMPANWRFAGLGDVTGEGKEDIVWQSDTGAVRVYTSQFDFRDVGSLGPDFQVEAVADFDGDGKADLMFRANTGRVNIWLADPSGLYVPQDYGLIGTDWTFQRAGDFNADGMADILWRNANGALNLWTSTGPTFTTRNLGPVGLDWTLQGLVDENGDGRSDIVWRNAGGFVSIWDGASNGGFTPHNIGVVSNSWQLQL